MYSTVNSWNNWNESNTLLHVALVSSSIVSFARQKHAYSAQRTAQNPRPCVMRTAVIEANVTLYRNDAPSSPTCAC